MRKLVSVMMLTLALGAFAFSQAGAGGGGGGGGRGQRGGGGGAQFARPGAQYTLLSHADVKTALKFSDDQNTKLEAATKARTDAVTAARGDGSGDPATMRAAMMKAGEEYSAAIAGILTSEQKTQLLGIFVVLAKNPALENPDVQAALGLGDEEKTKIKDLVAAEGKASAALRQQTQDGTMDATAAAAARTKNAETLSSDLLAALTDSHRSAFAKMGSDANFTPTAGTRYFGGGGGGRRGGGAAGGGAAGGGGGN